MDRADVLNDVLYVTVSIDSIQYSHVTDIHLDSTACYYGMSI